jgi:hypothetical protein
MEFKEFDPAGLNGLNRSYIDETKVNFDKYNAVKDDIYVEENFVIDGAANKVRLRYVKGAFQLMTGNSNHYITDKDLEKRFIKLK